MRNKYLAKVLVYNKIVTEDQIKVYWDKANDSTDIGQVLVNEGLLKPAVYQKVLSYVKDLEAKSSKGSAPTQPKVSAAPSVEKPVSVAPPKFTEASVPAQSATTEAPATQEPSLQIEGNNIYGASSMSGVEVETVVGLESTSMASIQISSDASSELEEDDSSALPSHFAITTGEGAPVTAPETLTPSTPLSQLIAFARKFGATDIYLYPDRQIAMRQSGNIVSVTDGILSHSDLTDRLSEAVDGFDDGYRIVVGKNFSKTAGISGVGRIRISVTWFNESPSISIRIIQSESASLENLYLPPFCEAFAELSSGLVIIAGPSFSGRSTTMMTFGETIAQNRDVYIQTIEKPIERLLHNPRGAVTQREVGLHVRTSIDGINLAIRNGADVILFDHLETMEELSLLLQASNAGALVFVVALGNNIHALLSRLLASVSDSARPSFAYSLAEQLKGVIVQHLVPVVQNEGLILACEAMKVTSTVANMIRKNDLAQIAAAISSQHDQGITLDDSLQKCVESGYIDGTEAWKRAYDSRRFASYRPTN